MSEQHGEIVIDPQEVKEMQDFLDGGGDGTDSVIRTYTVEMGNGFEVDIKVCDGDRPFVDPVLFHDGSEVCTIEVSDELCGEYQFYIGGDGGDTFTVIVRERLPSEINTPEMGG